MDAQAVEYPASKCEAKSSKHPEINAPSCMFPEPVFHQKDISVSGNNVIHRIEFQDLHDNRISHQRGIFHDPHDRCQPDSYLKYNVDDLCQIPKKITIALVA